MNVEQVHRYPRRLTVTIEMLSAIAVVLAQVLLGRDLLRLLWSVYTIDTTLFAQLPWLDDLVQVIVDTGKPAPERLDDLLPALLWMALALAVALLLRNSLPTVRTSARGILVAFVNDWLPVPWENIRAIKVTEAGNHYVLLVETDRGWLTGWHRWYSFVYRLGFRPAFLITSQISEFDELVKTLLSEADRAARTVATGRRIELQEDASSPLFRLLLSPTSFFAQRASQRDAAPASPTASGDIGDIIVGHYPKRISATLTLIAAAIAGAAVLRYGTLVMTYLAITFPGLRSLPVFNQLDLRLLPASWWLLVEAHVILVFLLGVALVIYHLLPSLEACNEGLIVHRWRGKLLVPWSRLHLMKVTEFSENSQVVLIQVSGGLPLDTRFVSVLYDGSLAPGILITSAMHQADALLQRIVLEAMRHHQYPDAPTFQSNARSNLLLLSVQTSTAVNCLVEDARHDPATQRVTARQLMRVLLPAFGLAVLPALMLFADRAFVQHIAPDGRLIGAILVILLLALLEWPLVSLAIIALDEMSGGGEEGIRPLYLYPQVQQPRLFLMLAALIVLLLGIQPLAALLWLGAIGWSFWLAAGLWSALYDWRGGQLIGGGLISVVFQLTLLIGYLVVRE